MTEAQDAVDAVVAELGKASAEINAKIDDLQAQINVGQVPDLTALKAAAQALDDIVPDAPAPDPTPVPDPTPTPDPVVDPSAPTA